MPGGLVAPKAESRARTRAETARIAESRESVYSGPAGYSLSCPRERVEGCSVRAVLRGTAQPVPLGGRRPDEARDRSAGDWPTPVPQQEQVHRRVRAPAPKAPGRR